MNTQPDTMREAFEQQLKDQLPDDKEMPKHLRRSNDGDYVSEWVVDRWEGWQAATEQATAAQTGEQIKTALAVALSTLNQIASTPRNKGARRHAFATVKFLETQLDQAIRKGEALEGG